MRSVFLQRSAARSLDAMRPVKRFLVIWLPAILGIVVVVTESTPTFSAANTSSWLRPVLERWFGHFGDASWAEVHHLLRKAGHFMGYGTLCVLFLRTWLLTFARDAALTMRAWRWRSWAFGVASTFVVACGDELHQTFLPSRTGLFSDVVLDTFGGMVATGIVLGVCWAVRRSRGWE